MVSDHIVEEIRARAEIVEILSDFMSLKRSGKGYRGPCPLHGGDGPNFAVDPDRQLFKCFVCDEGGDVFGFLMKHLGLEFPEAVRQVGVRVGVEVPERDDHREDPHAPLRGVLAFAAEWYASSLTSPQGEKVREYLQRRGMSLEDATKYGVGFAPDEWRGLRNAAVAQGFDDKLLLEVGLLGTSDRSAEPYDRFRGRLMFTIQDLRERPIAFGGRILDPNSDAPKYLNSPESPVFHKGDELYGLNWARHSMRREGHAAIVEGFTDVIALHRAGHEFAVAGLGTAFTRQQAHRLSRYAKKCHLIYDSDSAGLRATFRTADILLGAGMQPMVVTLPQGEDPDSLIRREGPSAITELMDDAVDVLERKLQILGKEGYLERIEGRRRAFDGLLSTLRAVSDPALRDLYVTRAVDGLGVRRDTLVHEIARGTRGERVRSQATRPNSIRRSVVSPIEKELMLLLVRDQDGSLVQRALSLGFEAHHLEDRMHREIFEALVREVSDGNEHMDWSEISSPAQKLVERLLNDVEVVVDPNSVFEAAVSRLFFREHRERLAEIDRELELADSEQQLRLLGEKQELAAELRNAGESVTFMPGARRGLVDRKGFVSSGLSK